jgi:hypothetical protein
MFLGFILCENYELNNVILEKGKDKGKNYSYLVVYPLSADKLFFRGFV